MLYFQHDKGNLKYLKDYCNRINISKNVIFMNFLEEDDRYFTKCRHPCDAIILWSHKHSSFRAFFLVYHQFTLIIILMGKNLETHFIM